MHVVACDGRPVRAGCAWRSRKEGIKRSTGRWRRAPGPRPPQPNRSCRAGRARFLVRRRWKHRGSIGACATPGFTLTRRLREVYASRRPRGFPRDDSGVMVHAWARRLSPRRAASVFRSCDDIRIPAARALAPSAPSVYCCTVGSPSARTQPMAELGGSCIGSCGSCRWLPRDVVPRSNGISPWLCFSARCLRSLYSFSLLG